MSGDLGLGSRKSALLWIGYCQVAEVTVPWCLISYIEPRKNEVRSSGNCQSSSCDPQYPGSGGRSVILWLGLDRVPVSLELEA